MDPLHRLAQIVTIAYYLLKIIIELFRGGGGDPTPPKCDIQQ